MDSFLDAFLASMNKLDLHLRQNYGFVVDYLPTSLVTFLTPYVNMAMSAEEAREQLPMMLAKVFLASFVFCSISFYILIHCYLSPLDQSLTYSETDEVDSSSSSEDDDDDNKVSVDVSDDKKQESTA